MQIDEDIKKQVLVTAVGIGFGLMLVDTFVGNTPSEGPGAVVSAPAKVKGEGGAKQAAKPTEAEKKGSQAAAANTPAPVAAAAPAPAKSESKPVASTAPAKSESKPVASTAPAKSESKPVASAAPAASPKNETVAYDMKAYNEALARGAADRAEQEKKRTQGATASASVPAATTPAKSESAPVAAPKSDTIVAYDMKAYNEALARGAADRAEQEKKRAQGATASASVPAATTPAKRESAPAAAPKSDTIVAYDMKAYNEALARGAADRAEQEKKRAQGATASAPVATKPAKSESAPVAGAHGGYIVAYDMKAYNEALARGAADRAEQEKKRASGATASTPVQAPAATTPAKREVSSSAAPAAVAPNNTYVVAYDMQAYKEALARGAADREAQAKK
ncbi:MAG: hypothetical protein H7834_00895 [Magnetococcus sp. YQC-9]